MQAGHELGDYMGKLFGLFDRAQVRSVRQHSQPRTWNRLHHRFRHRRRGAGIELAGDEQRRRDDARQAIGGVAGGHCGAAGEVGPGAGGRQASPEARRGGGLPGAERVVEVAVRP